MSMKGEYDGIALNNDRFLRALLATLFLKGERRFKIPREILQDEPWTTFDISASYDHDNDGYIVRVRSHDPRLESLRVIPAATIEDAVVEYEIEPPKQLKAENP